MYILHVSFKFRQIVIDESHAQGKLPPPYINPRELSNREFLWHYEIRVIVACGIYGAYYYIPQLYYYVHFLGVYHERESVKERERERDASSFIVVIKLACL